MEVRMAVQKRKYLGACLITVFVVLALYFCAAGRANAAEKVLALDNQWVSGTISTSGDADFYSFSIPSAGFVHLEYQGWSIADSYFEVLDEGWGNSFAKNNIYTSSDTNPKTKTYDLCFEAGTYFAKVSGCGSHVGDYKLRGSFTSANNNESELNNGFEQAMPLAANTKITGLLSLTDAVDFYRIVVPDGQKAVITYTSMIRDSYYSVWDQNFMKLKETEVYYASEDSPKTSTYDVLAAGTYYIKVVPYSNGHTGRYYLSWTGAKVAVTSVTIEGEKAVEAYPGDTISLKATIKPDDASNRTLSWTSSDSGIASVDENGKVTAHKAGSADITASATDGSGAKASMRVTVLPKKVSSVKISGSKTVTLGKTVALQAAVQPADATNKSVSWQSSNASVASVDSNGRVKAKKIGKAKITATAKDGSGVKASFQATVLPKKMSAPKLKSLKNRKLQLSWKTQSGATGYQIQYSTKKNMKGAKSKSVSGSKLTLSGLKKNQTYYVRIRAYYKSGSKKYYGSWSSAAKRKVK